MVNRLSVSFPRLRYDRFTQRQYRLTFSCSHPWQTRKDDRARDLSSALRSMSARRFSVKDASRASRESQQRDSSLGTCPESVSHRSDFWALGCVLYQLLAGRPPFQARTEYLMFQKIINLQYDFPPGFPQHARDLVEKLLVRVRV